MTAWTCPECASYNGDDEAECSVCGLDRRAIEPAATEETPTPITAVTGVVRDPTDGYSRTPTEPPDRPVDTSPAIDMYGTDRYDDDPVEVVSHPATTVSGGRSGPRNPWTRWAPAAALALGIAAVAGLKVIPEWKKPEPRPRSGSTAAPVFTPPSAPGPTVTYTQESVPSAEPSVSGGLVTVDPLAASDPRAQPVADLLLRYFTAINDRDFSSALSVYDPAGVVNPDDPAQADAFTRALSTTNDSEVRLRGITTDTSGNGAVQANVTFRSRQDPGYGPKSSPNETCTDWTLTFTLSQRDGGGYLILSSTGDHSPCS